MLTVPQEYEPNNKMNTKETLLLYSKMFSLLSLLRFSSKYMCM